LFYYKFLKNNFVKGFPLTQNKKIIQNSLLRSMVSVVQGDDWRRVRNTITPAFTAAKLKKVGK